MTATEQLPGRVIVCDDPESLAETVAGWLIGVTAAERPHVDVAVAGGSTPKRLYELLAAAPHRDAVDWTRWRVWFGDERACPPDDPRSNYAMVRSALLDLVPIPPTGIHRMEAERPDLDAAAAEYSALLSSTCPAGPTGAPALSVVLLGLGSNGHTASLFPGTAALDERDAWAARGLADYEPYDRITLTFPAINAARHVAFLVSGHEKAEALRGVVDGTVPAARVAPESGELHWFLDREAAGAMTGA